MRKLWVIYPVVVLMFSFCFALSPLAQEKKEAEDVYTIKKGDTLWDVSSRFLKDPFLWPKLWQRNPYITNPHWIYPGKTIQLFPLEELKKELPKEVVVEEKPKEEKPIEKKPSEEKPKEVAVGIEVKKEEPPSAEVKPEAVAVAKPPEAKPVEKKPDFFQDRRASGFLSDMDFRGIGIILDSKEGKFLISAGDIVYLAFKTSKPIRIGDKYSVFRATEEVRHPVTDKRIATRYNMTGNVQIIDHFGNFFTAKVIESFDAIFKGDMLQPYMKERMEAEEGK